MAFRISLNKATTKAAQLGTKAKADEDAKAREEKNALDRVMADLVDEHSEEKGILGEMVKDHDEENNVFVPTGSKRHFTGRPRSMKSGPGTLDSEDGPAFSRSQGPGGFGGAPHSRFGGPATGGPAALDGNRGEENVYTTVVAKASNLPPAMQTGRVEELFAEFPSLKVVKVEKLPASRPSSPPQRSRPSASMKVIFDKDANARDLDDAMNKMNDKKYLGKGYYLHLDRYLGGRTVSTKQQEEPFGATLHDIEVSKGFAPPPDLGGRTREHAREDMMNQRMMVTANAPPDLPTLRLVHQTIEGVIEGGVEFEAALMQDPQVQEEERFAWLFDQKHPLNRYYRWRLHELLSSTSRSDVFQRHPEWRGPKEALQDEFASSLYDLNHAYSDSSDEDEDDKPARVTIPAGDAYPGRATTAYGIMPPRSRALLIWLLATLPPSSALSDEIAAFSTFAVDHVTKGLDEVVHLLITNLIQPFALSPANPKLQPRPSSSSSSPSDDPDPDPEPLTRHRIQSQTPQLTTNALRIISDVALTTSKEPGLCYKYRSVIGAHLTDRNVFAHLERLPERCGMGRLAENQFRDEVNGVLRVWGEEHLFEKDVLGGFDEAFNGRRRVREGVERERRAVERRRGRRGAVLKRDGDGDGDGEGVGYADEMEDVPSPEGGDDDAPMEIDGGTPAETPAEVQATSTSEDVDVAMQEAPKQRDTEPPPEIPGETAAARARRLRPKAEDMFASDEE